MKQDNTSPKRSRRFTEASETMSEIDQMVRGLVNKVRSGKPLLSSKQIEEAIKKLQTQPQEDPDV